jgi:hypothetical protein
MTDSRWTPSPDEEELRAPELPPTPKLPEPPQRSSSSVRNCLARSRRRPFSATLVRLAWRSPSASRWRDL